MTTTESEPSLPSPCGPGGWMAELTEGQRKQLPAVYHRPHFDGLATPNTWICQACWGEGWMQPWPCSAARAGGVELAKSMQVGWSW